MEDDKIEVYYKDPYGKVKCFICDKFFPKTRRMTGGTVKMIDTLGTTKKTLIIKVENLIQVIITQSTKKS